MLRPLTGDRVDLWVLALPAELARVERELEVLSAPERERMERFRFERHRAAFARCRGFLRLVLGACLGRPPASLELEADEHGKPRLPGRELEFNVSHTEGLGLLAVGRGAPLGCDVEALATRVSPEELAPRVFNEDERAELDAHAPEERRAAFLRGWTRKEAFVKARGEGLSGSLTRFSVSLAPGPVALRLHDPGLRREGWSLHDLALGPDHVGALCARAGLRVELQGP